MNILFFDTETNGLPLKRNAPETLVENWPRAVSIAWRLCELTPNDSSMKILSEQYWIVKPYEGMSWPEEAVKIHGIPREKALQEGTPVAEILQTFRLDAQKVNAIVAHNMAFDRPVMLCEGIRAGFPVDWWPVNQFCTMDSTKGLCKLPSKFGRPSDPYKYPRLSELHTFLFGNAGDFAFHCAQDDVRCLVKCFEELHFRRLVPVGGWASDEPSA